MLSVMDEEQLKQKTKLQYQFPSTIGFGGTDNGSFLIDTMIHKGGHGDNALIVTKYEILGNKVRCGAYCFGSTHFSGHKVVTKEGDLSSHPDKHARPHGLVFEFGQWRICMDEDFIIPMTREDGVETLLAFLRDPKSNTLMDAAMSVYPCGDDMYCLSMGNIILVVEANKSDVKMLGCIFVTDTLDEMISRLLKDTRERLTGEHLLTIKRGLLAAQMAENM